VKLTEVERSALHLLAKQASTSSEVGEHVWPERAEREGAERKVRFAAQMLLGRLRRRRLCAALSTTGSTVWAIEPAGRLALRNEVSP